MMCSERLCGGSAASDGRLNPENSGEISALHIDSGGEGENESAVLPTRARMRRRRENERLTMNQSEVETPPSEWRSGAEGQPRSETHALASRVEDDAAPVAREYLLPW